MIITEHTGVMSSVTEDGVEPGKGAKGWRARRERVRKG